MSMPVISAMDFTGDKMVDETAPNDSPMKRFYRHKTVFITGGTGFLGQLFIEKLLRCKVKEIYVLARPKKSKSPAERIQEIFVGALFAKLKSTDPKYLTKIKIIDGDTSKFDLGISDGDRKKIVENVEIVIHAAANVRFDIPLQELCFTNVRGTKVLTALAGEIKKLVVFAYVSTAYAQYYREKFEEKFYPPAIDPDQMIRIAEHFEQCQTDELNFLTDKLLQPWKNTYVFTKSLAEEVVRRAGNKFPIVVIRPSVIISTFDDPIPGWSNNFYGLNGMVVGTGLGFIKLCPCKAESKNDAVCADIVTNGTLAAIWCKAIESESTDAYNFDESKAVVHITSQDLVDYGTYTAKLLKLYLQNPSAKSIWFPSVTFTDSRFLIFVLSILYHAIPAAMFDVYFKLTKNELRLLPIYRKSQDFLARLDYFANREWHFVNKNLKTVIEKMCPEDRDFFHCDVFNFKLLEYSYVYVLGLRAYVVKEPLTIDEAAKRKFLLLRFAHYLTTLCCYGVLGCIIYLFLHVAGLAYHLTIFCNSLLSLLDPDEVHAASGSNLTFVTKKIRLMK